MYWDVPIGHVMNIAGSEQCYNISKFTDVRRETAPLTVAINLIKLSYYGMQLETFYFIKKRIFSS